MKKSNIDLTILVELKESRMSDKEIAEYLATQEINIAPVTISKILKKYYDSIGKKKPRKPPKPRYTDTINIKKLVDLKESGMSDKEIVEYLRGQGIIRSESTIGTLLRDYYKFMGQEKPRKPREYRGANPIDINELVKLKEKGMSDKEITEYLATQGINRPEVSIGKIIKKYYDSIGQEKPRKPRIKRKKIEERIDIEELARLKEEAEMTDKEISEYLERAGINKSKSAVFQMLREYYQSQGKEKPKIKRNLTIDILTLIRLKEEKGMSDKDIVDYLNENAIEISESSINIRLMQYYNSPEGDRTNIKLGIILNGEKLAKIKESQNMSNKEISEYFQEMGISINSCHIDTTLIQYYTAQGKEVFRKISDNPNKKPIPIKELSSNRYDDDIEEMLMRGMTLKEFILNNRKYQKEDEIRVNLKKLRVVAEYAKKERNIIIPDLNFTTVLDALEESEEKIGAYVKKLMNFMNDGALEEGKLNKAKNMVFLGNVDLMIYIFERLNIKLYPGQDVTLFRNLKNAYRNKIRRYLRTVEQTDANRRKKQQEDNVMEISDM